MTDELTRRLASLHPQDAATAYMETRGISEATCLEFGIGYDAQRQAITFPYFDAQGRQTAARWRFLHPSANPRYMGPRGARLPLYNVVDTDETWVYLTEGEIDCLTLKQLGLAAVGVPGAEAWRDAWRWLFVDRKVRIIFDADPVKSRTDGSTFRPGQDAAARIMRVLSSTAEHVEIVKLPVNDDVNSLHQKGLLAPFVT